MKSKNSTEGVHFYSRDEIQTLEFRKDLFQDPLLLAHKLKAYCGKDDVESVASLDKFLSVFIDLLTSIKQLPANEDLGEIHKVTKKLLSAETSYTSKLKFLLELVKVAGYSHDDLKDWIDWTNNQLVNDDSIDRRADVRFCTKDFLTTAREVYGKE